MFSYTDHRENILNYSPWTLKKGDETRTINVVGGSSQGKTIVAQLDGVTDRDQAASLMGFEVLITEAQLPETSEGEYYWSDLVGLKVETEQGVPLGVVESLLETGANDVLIIKGERERAIPFLREQTIKLIDLESGVIIVDWDTEF